MSATSLDFRSIPELRWDGKYDTDGRRVPPVRLALPFQTVETVNESVQDRQRTLDLFSEGRDPGWRNRLIWGDKKYVLPALLPDFQGKVDLIYVDPPYATGADFSFRVEIGDRDFTKIPNVIEQKAYRDTWAHGLDSYLRWFAEGGQLFYDLLSPTGSIVVHLDWHVSHYVKTLMDELFGGDQFRNELVWVYGSTARGAKAIATQFPRNHDVLLWYARSSSWTFNQQRLERRIPISEASQQGFRQDEEGRWFKTSPRGDYTDESIAELASQGRIHHTNTGGIRIKYFLRHEKGVLIEDLPLGGAWIDIPDAMHLPDIEKTGYATQKPERLLSRVIATLTNPGDLVMDCFVGSGTTAVAAEKLGRRWIVGDLGRFAIHTSRKRLLGLQSVAPFVVQNLGKYERQAWQSAEFGSTSEGLSLRYRNFILRLYRATPMTGYNWIHGMKAGHAVHVGAVDAPVSPGDVQQIAVELAKLRVGSGSGGPKAIDVLGWDFAFELNEVAKQQAARAGIDLRFFRIPHDVMDKEAVSQGDISFFELAALSVSLVKKGRAATVSLTDFVIPLDDVPEEIQKAVTDWSQWIDYWAIDWDNRDDTFHNVWQSYRSHAAPKLERIATHNYEAPGRYTIVVKVIDILGNDTTKALSIDVK